MKNKGEITRTKVKEDYDPLVQIKKETDKLNQENIEKNTEKNNNNKNLSNPLLDSILASNYERNSNMNKSLNQPVVQSSSDFNSNKTNNTLSKAQITSKTVPDLQSKTENATNNRIINQLERNQVDNDKELEFFKKNTKMKSESILCYEQGSFKYFEDDLEGKIIMTDYRLIFTFSHKKFVQEDYFIIPLLMIKKLEKVIEKKTPGKYFIEISTKDNRTIKICILGDEQHRLYYNLNIFSNPKEVTQFYKFAFKYRENYPDNSNIGWEIFNPIEEYLRQGINFDDPKNPFKLILNKNYQICETYPEMFILPKSFSDEDLMESRHFRTKNRVPVFCWMNKKTNATLWRSSQTKGGITQQRCVRDEKLLKLIGELGGDHLIIFDARPYLNALANRLKGAGFENTDNYYNTEIHFCEIDNIHCVRGSITKLFTLCKDEKINENRKFLSTLEQSQWYDFIHLLLKSAVEISDKLRKCSSVLIHCSDGWDRSSQLITLSELILDPYYRTIKGFIVLIEKEWLSFGHQFAYRSGLYVKEMSEDQRAPIFLQWLDCIHQLQYQYPHAFEFNGELLIFLAHHLNTCLYGTFLFNHEKEREERKAKEKTVSIWSDVLENIHLYKNTFYSKDSNQYLYPNFSQYKIRFWEEYFLRWNMSYITSLKKQHQGEVRKSFINTNYFFEYNKKEDSIMIENQKKKIENYEMLFKEICKVTIEKNIFEELPEEIKNNLTNCVDYEDLDVDYKESKENTESIKKEEISENY